MPDLIPENDSPPGAPAYASGPLAVQTPSAAAARASGLPLNQYLAPVVLPPPPQATPNPLAAPLPLTLGERAASFAQRAAAGIANLFGSPTATPAPTNTAKLETGLNDLERRSTIINPTAPNFYQQRMAQLAATP